MGILGLIFQSIFDALFSFWTYLLFRDTCKLPKTERTEAQAEAIVAGLIVLGVVLVLLLIFAYVSLT